MIIFFCKFAKSLKENIHNIRLKIQGNFLMGVNGDRTNQLNKNRIYL
jgi:hypothetical protein